MWGWDRGGGEGEIKSLHEYLVTESPTQQGYNNVCGIRDQWGEISQIWVTKVGIRYHKLGMGYTISVDIISLCIIIYPAKGGFVSIGLELDFCSMERNLAKGAMVIDLLFNPLFTHLSN